MVHELVGLEPGACMVMVLLPAEVLNVIEPVALLAVPRLRVLAPWTSSVPGMVVATPALPIVIVPLVPVAVPTSRTKLPELLVLPVALPVRMVSVLLFVLAAD